MAGATKTTFFLSDSRRARLKALAVERNTTVTELLAEATDLLLQRYQGKADQATLLARAKQARAKLRAGLYSGRSTSSESIDEVVYGLRKYPRKRR
ncbi:MAG TPA: ribbon-helix-helix domain-containing protein [Polyangiaceae bacterium]|nr:ribbon-helix-helix domain-containing protein [Polyangiaceae bacterium]